MEHSVLSVHSVCHVILCVGWCLMGSGVSIATLPIPSTLLVGLLPSTTESKCLSRSVYNMTHI